MAHNLFDSHQTFSTGSGQDAQFYSVPALEKHGFNISRLPVSIRIVLESVLRNYDDLKISEQDVKNLASWKPNSARVEEIPFVVARIVLQDFTGVPLLVDLAAMRSAAGRMNKDAKIIEPLVPVDLVVDHSVQVDFANVPNALMLNMDIEFKRNASRYQFLKWGMQAFDTFSVVPPGIGIVHQVNLEYLAKGVLSKDDVYYPDTLVGTDSHTTMINGLGIVGWGVGGIEAEAGMLGQPVYFLTPDVVGVNLTGKLKEGVTATDLVLRVTEMLRSAKVVGKFVEFFGEGAEALSLPDRATIANMAPEYGATMGFFPTDEETLKYMTATGRPAELVDTVRNYYKAQGLFGIPKLGDIDYSQQFELSLSSIEPAVAGPKRPQDRIDLSELKEKFTELFSKPISQSGFNKAPEDLGKDIPLTLGYEAEDTISGGGNQDKVPAGHEPLQSFKNTATYTEREMVDNRPSPDRVESDKEREYPRKQDQLGNGDVVIAAITSCTNTSNPSVMLAAGLVAKKAVAKGMKVRPTVKTSLAPGSRVVTEYLEKTGLQDSFDQLGFFTVGYGCTTCIGNSGPLDPHLEKAIIDNDFVVASVLSGNRNFEARVHQSIKANFLMSPPLVVAFALAGRIDIDVDKEPLGVDSAGNDVFLKDVWPTTAEIDEALKLAFDADTYEKMYSDFSS
ncbi:aconitate hydratase AcnA, partial [bacterium]